MFIYAYTIKHKHKFKIVYALINNMGNIYKAKHKL